MQKKLLWQSDQGNGTYQNPILFADYSDPDVIRVGETFYMTASSFNYTPGLPILISRDLVNWTLKNYAVENINYDSYSKPAHAKGIWAPAIRYHNETFYIYYGMPDEGIFMVQAEDPLGKWSDPILILEGKGYIDPCPFWDDDGKSYIIHGYAKSRIGFKSILGIFEMSPDGRKAIGDDRFIFDGTISQPTIEGPKVYKRNGWYYIFAPAGSVKTGWQTVLRAKHIEGPYEERIVMASRDTDINGPHQGGLVDTPIGDEWFVHFQDRGLYGRIVHLQPVVWGHGWPIIGHEPDEMGCGKPVILNSKPEGLPKVKPTYLKASDDFDSTRLGLQWQWFGNHSHDFYNLRKDDMVLRLYSKNTTGEKYPTLWHSANVLTQKLVCPEFECDIHIICDGMKENEQAGLVMLGGQYAYLALRNDALGSSIVYVESDGDDNERKEHVHHREALASMIDELFIKMTAIVVDNDLKVEFSYSLDGNRYSAIRHEFYPSDHTWVGTKIGLFAQALDMATDHGHCDFDYIHLKRR